jgi:hypothetical protein
VTSQNLDFGRLPQASSRSGFRLSEIGASIRASGGEILADGRTGKNGRYQLVGLLRQSVFGQLAGYEGVNDAERLCRDPAMPLGGRRSGANGGLPQPARWAASRPISWPGRRTGPLLRICLGDGSTPCTSGARRGSSCSTGIRASPRPKATRNAALIRATSAAPATTCCVCSTNSVIWSGAPCGPATSTAPTAGEKCWTR